MKNNSLFEQVRNNRNMQFLYIGIPCDYDGDKGNVTGASGGGLLVTFNGTKRPIACHPQSAMTYYNEDGSVLKDYKEKAEEA